ncbi:hypothetical protein [Staphylococcus equorum]|uniref:hypothetical protein n=2 Tax=Staphylococcus TaxID=1279 RepID=UPI0012E9BFB3|nr:hypothetical protein [Staphylococcus equorum]MDK9850231.1 hypothetical protein [Staphylococcus equorum]
MTETEYEIIIDKVCSDYSPNKALEKVMYEYLKEEENIIQYTNDEMDFAKKT